MRRVPAGPIDVMSLPVRNVPSRFPNRARRSRSCRSADHDFV